MSKCHPGDTSNPPSRRYLLLCLLLVHLHLLLTHLVLLDDLRLLQALLRWLLGCLAPIHPSMKERQLVAKRSLERKHIPALLVVPVPAPLLNLVTGLRSTPVAVPRRLPSTLLGDAS